MLAATPIPPNAVFVIIAVGIVGFFISGLAVAAILRYRMNQLKEKSLFEQQQKLVVIKQLGETESGRAALSRSDEGRAFLALSQGIHGPASSQPAPPVKRCFVCNGKIVRWGFDPAAAQQYLQTRAVKPPSLTTAGESGSRLRQLLQPDPKRPQDDEAMETRGIGAVCVQCRQVICAYCYRKGNFICVKCRSTIDFISKPRGAITEPQSAVEVRPALEEFIDAAGRGDLVTVTRHLEAGIDVNGIPSAVNWTALHEAAIGGHLVVVQKLLAAGASVNAQARFGKATPLLLAADQGHVAVIKALVESGADLEATQFPSGTALASATVMARPAIVDLLLSLGANPLTKVEGTNLPLLELARRLKHSGLDKDYDGVIRAFEKHAANRR